MVTIRSQYGFDQFYEKLHEMAHGLAIYATTNLVASTSIKINSGRKITEVDTSSILIRFQSHISYTQWGKPVKQISRYRECPSHGWTREEKCPLCGKATRQTYDTIHPDQFSLDIEAKSYTDSNHRTKISYYGQKEKVEAFIAELMKDETIEPRFKMAEYTKSIQKEEVSS